MPWNFETGLSFVLLKEKFQLLHEENESSSQNFITVTVHIPRKMLLKHIQTKLKLYTVGSIKEGFQRYLD